MYYFIVNPKSRTDRGLQVWCTVKKELDEKNYHYTAYLTEHKHHACELARIVCNSVTGIKNIVVVGGDGTLNEVLNGIYDFKEVILGYIPSGSSNDFAQSLHIPSDPLAALDLILNPKHYEYVDIGELEATMANGNDTLYRRFAVSSGIGYDASICHEALHSKLKRFLNYFHLGKLTYLLIAFKQALTYQPVDGHLIVDGGKRQDFKKILLCVSMIHRYEGGGQALAPQADYKDQMLSICLVHNLSRMKVLMLLPTICFGGHTHIKGVEIFNCKKLELKLASETITHTDGEFAGRNQQIQVRCNRLTLRVYTPTTHI